jgi:hypothetical protein
MKIEALAFALVICAATVGCAARNAEIEIPNNFTGWVVVHHSARDCGRADKGGWFRSVVEVQPNGRGCSARWQGTNSLSLLHFFYVSPGQRVRKLDTSGWGGGGEIWGLASRPDKQEIYFFVGPEVSFQHAPPPR